MPPRYRVIADAALEDTFTLQGVTARQPRLSNGGYAWNWKGPNDDPEWAWFFNRHGWFKCLWRAYTRTKEGAKKRGYRGAIFGTLNDWIEANPAPGRFNFSAAWRPLEVARRLLDSWLPLMDDLLGDSDLSDGLRAKLKASLLDHGRHLRRHHALGGNHLITEMRALLYLGYSNSDFVESADWIEYGLSKMDAAYLKQVYPDGVHKELSSHYHRIITQDFSALVEMLVAAGVVDQVDVWRQRVDLLWHYLKCITKPNGMNPINNDCDLEDFGKLLRKEAPQSIAAEHLSSCHFPWAGQTIFRNDALKQWAFFDAGPRGTDHAHDDHLNFIFSVDEADFLIDPGRYTYAPSAWRDYFRGARGHNIVLLDSFSSDQNGSEAFVKDASICYQSTLSEVSASGTTVFYDAKPRRLADWNRSITYDQQYKWCVRDEVITFGSRRMQTLWHWHSDCRFSGDVLSEEGLIIKNGVQAIRMRLKTDNRILNSMEVISGVVGAEIQGWYSPRFNYKEAAPVFVFKQEIIGPCWNEWEFCVLPNL